MLLGVTRASGGKKPALGAISSTFQTRGEPSPIRGIVVSADEPETVRARNGLCSLLDIELNEDMLDVRFDGQYRSRRAPRFGWLALPRGQCS
jgi:hypothetical protein